MSCRCVLLACALTGATQVAAMGPFEARAVPYVMAVVDAGPVDAGDHPENTRLLASGLAVLLGPFGAHRLYLGTTPKVAIIYGVTFGGFGVLALLDLGHILFTKDLDPYRNSDRVFMWSRGQGEATPP